MANAKKNALHPFRQGKQWHFSITLLPTPIGKQWAPWNMELSNKSIYELYVLMWLVKDNHAMVVFGLDFFRNRSSHTISLCLVISHLTISVSCVTELQLDWFLFEMNSKITSNFCGLGLILATDLTNFDPSKYKVNNPTDAIDQHLVASTMISRKNV